MNELPVTQVPEAMLHLVLAPRWQRVEGDRLLHELLVAARDIESRHPLSDQQALTVEILEGARRVFRNDKVLLCALRWRDGPQAVDFLTVALPEPPTLDASNRLNAPVLLGGRDSASDEPRIFPARVQVLAPIKGSSRAALLTLVSTAADADLELEAVAEAMADSLTVS